MASNRFHFETYLEYNFKIEYDTNRDKLRSQLYKLIGFALFQMMKIKNKKSLKILPKDRDIYDMSLQKGIKVEKMRTDVLKSFSYDTRFFLYEGHRPIYATTSKVR